MGFWEAGELLVLKTAARSAIGNDDPDFAHRPAVKSVKSGYSSCPVTHARHYTDSRNLMRRLTVSEWVGTVSFLGLGVVLAACYRYGVAKPAHDGAEVLRSIQQVQIGRTGIQELQELLAQNGPESVKLSCGPTLDYMMVHPATPALPSTPGNAAPHSDRQPFRCLYQAVVTNSVLHKLHLAPSSGLLAQMETNDHFVTSIWVWSDVGDYGELAQAQFQQADRLTPECGKDICVERYSQSDGRPFKVHVTFAAYADTGKRNKILSVDVSCLSKVGGCKNIRELIPAIEHQ
jgi:hypothetical protein